jgi:outer membrane protein OmpA-like peptidoglycan-associated protein
MEKTKPAISLILTASLLALLGACATQNTAPSAAATPVSTSAANTTPPSAPPSTTNPTVAQQIAAIVADNKAVIVFPEGSDTLTPDANHSLDLAARLFRDANPVVMFASGYTDATGNDYNNLLLSARRAEAIKHALVARGIPENRLLIQAFGQSVLANPNDPTGAVNRRVVITWNLH